MNKELPIMATNETPYARPNGLLKLLTCLSVIALAFVAVVIQWPTIRTLIPTPGPIIIIATPQAAPLPAPAAPRPALPAAQPRPAMAQPAAQPAIDAYNATAEAVYQQALEVAPPVAPVENVGQGAAVELNSKAVPDRQPAGDNVPTAMPLPQTANDGQHGSKSKPVNIQETHQCLHGQVWIDGKGCKNP
jgi:hypothetical protein